MAFSGNPLTVEPPESIAALSPELYAYLRELNKTLHENYEKQESGAATFPADRFFSRYAKQEYPLGSEGRFVHADYGVLRGIFVRFAETALEPAIPLGWELQRFGQGFATSDFNKSETVLFLGFDLTQGPGEYGWVLSQGILPATLNVAGGAGAFLEWGAAGMTATGISTGVSLIEAPEEGVAEIGSVLLKLSNAGDGLTGLENELANLTDQLTGLEERIIELDSDFEGVITLQNDVVTINQKLDRVSQSVTIANRAIAEFNADGVTATMEQMLSVSRQYYDLTRGISENVDGMYQQVVISTNASFDAKQQAKSWSDQSGIYSQVSAERAGYAAIQAGASGESATAAFNYKEEALVYRDAAGNFAAEASTYASISASYGTGLGQIVLNPVFAIWPVADPFPTNWGNWVAGTTSIMTRENYAANQNRIKFDMTVPQANFGIAESVPDQAPGEYVMEADVELVSGSWAGAGISVGGLPGLECQFSVEKDINGVVSSSQLGRRRFSKRFTWAGNGGVAFNFFLMANWSTFAAATAKVLRWYGATIRPVDGAYLTNKADIITEQSVRANADSAMASQITTLNAYFSGFSGTVQGAITAEANTRASADSAMATQITTLNAYFVGFSGGTVEASITAEASTRAAADVALASRTSSLEANFGRDVGSPVKNPNFALWAGAGMPPDSWNIWTAPVTGTWVKQANFDGAGLNRIFMNLTAGDVNVGISQGLSQMAAGRYLIEIDAELTAGSWSGAGATFDGYSTDSLSLKLDVDPDTNGVVSSSALGVRKFSKILTWTGGSSFTLYLMGGWGSFSAGAAKELYIRRVNIRPIDGGWINTSARITTEETTRANADSALASSLSTLSTTVGGHTATLTTYGASISGLNAKYGVTIDVNGYVSGFELNGGGGTSSFIINANLFEIRKPGGGERTEYSNGAWKLYNSSGVMVGLVGNLAEWVP